MGIAQSSFEARPEQLEVVGPFALRSSSKKAIDILSEITTSLLTENSIFKLQDLLDPSQGCNELFIFISSTLDKQFQLLKVPDAKYPSKSATLGFVAQDKYAKSDTTDVAAARDAACNQISMFLVRLVTLMCALTASIKLNSQIALELSNNYKPTTVSDQRRMFLPVLPNRVNVDKATKDYFSVMRGTGKATLVAENPLLFRLKGTEKFIWNLARGLLYMDTGDRTPVFNISTDGYDNIPQGKSQAPAAPAGSVQTGVNVTKSSGASTTTTVPGSTGMPTSGGTRRLRRQRRVVTRRRRYVGGAIEQLYQVTLTEEPVISTGVDNPATGPKRYRFYLNNQGLCFSEPNVINFRTKGEELVGISLTVFLEEKFNQIINNRVNLVSEDSDKSISDAALNSGKAPTGDKYLSLKGISKESFTVFTRLSQAFSDKTGASPAGYRSFLLAKSLRENELDTKFCDDSWRGNVFTTSIAFTFLQLLYEEGRSDRIVTTEAGNELDKAIGDFVGAKLATLDPTATTKSFRSVLFAPLPTGLADFCKQSVASRTFRRPEQITVLTDAQRALRKLFDEHVGNVVRFVERVMTIKKRPIVGSTEYYFRLNEEFVKSSSGAIKLLESLIAEARTMLVKHFFEVERIYQSALVRVGDVR